MENPLNNIYTPGYDVAIWSMVYSICGFFDSCCVLAFDHYGRDMVVYTSIIMYVYT